MTERDAGPATPEPPGEPSGEGSVRLVGTAHVSPESVTTVEETVAEERPDVVAVELDEGRYRQLQGEAPEEVEPSDLLQGDTVFQFLAYWLLSYVQTRLGERFDVTPGADMLAGVEAAGEVGAGVALVDRNIQTTIQRFWARMSVREKLRMFGELVLAMAGVGLGDDEELSMEDLTDTDVVTAMMEEFRRFSPGGAEALVDERDAFIAHRLVALREAGYRVVAVVGAGHVEGVERYLEDPSTLPPMSSLTGTASRRFSPYRAFGYVLALGFLAFFVLLAMAGVDQPTLLEVFGAWFLFNGLFAAGLARLAGAHWTSAGVGGAVAWLTSVNPLLAPGWFAGYVELRYTTVDVGDIATLNEILADEESPIRDLWRRMTDVPLFRLVMVVAMTNVGSILASVLFPFVVLPLIGGPVGSVEAIGDLMVKGARNSAEAVVDAVA